MKIKRFISLVAGVATSSVVISVHAAVSLAASGLCSPGLTQLVISYDGWSDKMKNAQPVLSNVSQCSSVLGWSCSVSGEKPEFKLNNQLVSLPFPKMQADYAVYKIYYVEPTGKGGSNNVNAAIGTLQLTAAFSGCSVVSTVNGNCSGISAFKGFSLCSGEVVLKKIENARE